MKYTLLGDIAKISSGGTPDRSNPAYWGGTIPWVKTGEIQFGIIRNAEEKITPLALAESSAKLVPADSLLMAMYGQGKTRGQVALLGIEAAINQACAAISPHDVQDSRYLFQFLAANYENVRRLSNSGSQENLNAELIRNIRLFYPAKPEREKIADILGTWDEALEKLDALIAAKDRRKQALMQQLLTGQRRLPMSAGPLGFIRASEIFTNRTERNSRGAPILSVTQDQGVVFRDTLDRKIAHDTETNDTYKVVHPGDYIISLRSFQGGLEYSEILGAVSPAYHVIHPTKEIDCEFFRHYFKSADFVSRLAVAVIGIRDGKQISFADFGFIKLPYPHIDDQKRIGQLLSTADVELHLLRQQRAALDQQKRGLMQQLLTGEKRVTPAP